MDRAIFHFGRTGGGGAKIASPRYLQIGLTFFHENWHKSTLLWEKQNSKKIFSKNCIVTWWRHFQFPNMGENLRKLVKWGLSLNCHKFRVGIFFSILFSDSISKKVIKTNSIVKISKFQFFQDGGTAAAWIAVLRDFSTFFCLFLLVKLS